MKNRIQLSVVPVTLLFLALLATVKASAVADEAVAQPTEPQWLSLAGKDGAGKGKKIVFITGANEYGPESSLTTLARILSERHGFDCTVLYPINKKTGLIDGGVSDNVPGLENVDNADLIVVFTRFRVLPDDQMKHIVDYLEAGKPVIGLRTGTHAFKYPKSSTSAYKKFTSDNKDPAFEGGFGRQVLGETWITHRSPNGKTSVRSLFAPDAEKNPILRGISSGEIWAVTGEYGIRLPMLDGCTPLLMGQVLDGSSPTAPVSVGKYNEPLMPVAWTRTYSLTPGKLGRAFCATMGSDADVKGEAMRRLLVNACYWTTGLEDKIPEKSNVDLVGESVSPIGKRPSELAK